MKLFVNRVLSWARSGISPQTAGMIYSSIWFLCLTTLTVVLTYLWASRWRELSTAVPQSLESFTALKKEVSVSGLRQLEAAATHYREHREIERQAARFEADEHAAMAKAVSDLTGFERVMGRPIRVVPGPPQQYDAGGPPTYLWPFDWLAYWLSRDFFLKYEAWRAASTACYVLNNAESQYGSTLNTLRDKYRSSREELEAAKSTVVAVSASLGVGKDESQRNELTTIVMRWLELNQQNTWNTWGHFVFWVFEPITICSLILMTVSAGVRCALAYGWLRNATMLG